MAQQLMFMIGQEILTKLGSLALNEFTLAWNLQSDLEDLKKSLEMVNDLIRNASSNNNTQDASVQTWLKDLNSVAFKADVVLEDFAYQTLRCKIENRKRDKVLAVFLRQKLAHKIKNVKADLDKICHRGTTIGLIRQFAAAGGDDIANKAFYEERLTHPFIDDESKIVGRENDVLNVVKMLCDDDHDVDLSVVAVVGLGGQGKTTLAQLVFKDEKVVKHFDDLIWVCVSEEFVVTTLLNQMLQSCTRENPQLSNLQAIIEKLGEKLKNKRYLLVLDDVWNEDEDKWNKFRSALLGISGARGSKVMVTTRNDKVASTMQASSHPLVKLSDDDSWTMFKRRAFAPGGEPETEAFKTIGKEIVKRCFGLPLAIKVIASLMYSKKSEKEWLSVQNSLQLWNIADYNTDSVVQTLKLSYDHLPFQLKRCFCFCSIYPKDEVIKKDELIQCWMALGLLQVSSGCDQVMEDVGERYFETLLSMCLLQDIVKNEFGSIKSCKMHDLVHDLALMTTTTDYSTLNSVALVPSKHVNSQSPICPNETLRILVLNESIKGYSIKKLKHLRYLNIRGTDIKDLLSSFTTCYNLQTLKYFDLQSVSNHLAKFINLRHLNVVDVSGCWLNGIGQLTSLQTLPLFGVNREHGCHIRELESLNNLTGDFTIFGLDDVLDCEEAKLASLSKKRNLRRLTLSWGQPRFFFSGYSYRYKDSGNSESVLEGLEPHKNLKCLTIQNFKGGNFPPWMMVETHVLGRLVNLELRDCDKCERIPPLGHLQCLKVVKIISLSNVREIGLDFYGSSIGSEGMSLFPVLRELCFGDMPKLERWLEAVSRAFPCLQKLEIYGCPNLKSFPSHFPSLTTLSISDIDSLALKELSKMQASLTYLHLKSCRGSEFQSLLEDFLTRNGTSLTNLSVVECDEFVYLPDNLMALNKLEIHRCENLTDIQHCLPSARTVDISECSKLIGLPSLSQVFPVLEHFTLEKCNEIVALPDIGCHTCLQKLTIRNLAKISVPELCKSLRELTLYRCNALVSIPDFRYLRELSLWYGFRWTEEERGPSHFSLPFSSEVQYCLERLEFGGLPELTSLPDQFQHLTALTYLCLYDLDGLDSLPDWLGNIISLKTLMIYDCKKLKYFPSAKATRLYRNLSELHIGGCPLLEKRISKGTRPEWRNISHIPNIQINKKVIKGEMNEFSWPQMFFQPLRITLGE